MAGKIQRVRSEAEQMPVHVLPGTFCDSQRTEQLLDMTVRVLSGTPQDATPQGTRDSPQGGRGTGVPWESRFR